MVIIYDNTGKIWYNGSGNGEPVGLPFLNISIPVNQYVESIDVSQEPPVPVFKEFPKSELELMKEANEKQQADIDYLMLLNGSSIMEV